MGLMLPVAADAQASVTVPVPARRQSNRIPTRETTANRRARIERTIEETYGHHWEAAGGGGYQRFRTGPYLRQSNEVSFWVDTMYSLSPRLGILGNVQGSYGYAKIGNILPCSPGCALGFNPQISNYEFVAGPSYRFVRKEKYAFSGFAQGGLGLGKFDGGSKGYSASDIGVWTGTLAPAFTAGVSLDYNFDPSLALRITPEYVGTVFGSTLENSKALNIGIVYRFGKTK